MILLFELGLQLLDGEGGDDIWLWVDGDEEHIGTSTTCTGSNL